jgi:hypothetical protein
MCGRITHRANGAKSVVGFAVAASNGNYNTAMWVLALRTGFDTSYLNEGIVNNLAIGRIHWLENTR